MRGIELLWDALAELMELLNKPLPANKARHSAILSGQDQARMDREKMKGEALGVARAIALLEDRTVESVRQEAIARYVGEDPASWLRPE